MAERRTVAKHRLDNLKKNKKKELVLNNELCIGKKWHQRRKALTPAFHFKILEQFVEIFNRQSDVFVQVLSKYKPVDKIELYPIVTLYALDVVCGKFLSSLAKIIC